MKLSTSAADSTRNREGFLITPSSPPTKPQIPLRNSILQLFSYSQTQTSTAVLKRYGAFNSRVVYATQFISRPKMT